MRNLLIKMAAGIVGGAAATYVLMRAMPLSKRLPARMRPIAPNKDPAHLIVQRLEKRFGKLSPKMHSRAAQGMHFAYGISGPLALGALSGVLGLRTAPRIVAAGALLGAIVWAIGYEGWQPALGLTPHAHKVPLAKNATGLASHVAYGTLAALPLAIAGRRFEA